MGRKAMQPSHTPPRWFGLFTLSAGLYAAICLSMTAEDFWMWLFPTGLIFLAMACAGTKWIIRPRRPATPRS